MSSDTTVYRAQRWQAAFFAVVMIGTACWLVTPGFLSALPTANFHGKAAIINLLPVEARVPFVIAVALLLFYAGATFAKMLFDNRIVTIDDRGIEVARGFFVRRAAWTDFAGFVTFKYAAVRTVTLKFNKPGGTGKRSIGISTGLLGVKNEVILADIAGRVEAASMPAPAVSSRYDQRVAVQTAGRPRVGSDQPRVFGKR
jgi:hypothetical protein